ncbi:S8 family serine peptidase [Streptomyces sp. YC504]|uniref:S8 family serine peptidase n=1 Tax=Streptomyces mesophilus TaxID=1775132 RepID=A0A6G4XTS6_9ACTN|nr:S8 family serine peptidase [Streptomyces mesophilus]NGO80180.1 S8 family serine peptidase [Streptomyces mesophilus]
MPRRRYVATAAVCTVLAVTAAVPAVSSPVQAATAAGAAMADGPAEQPRTLTLVTGETLSVSSDAEGRTTATLLNDGQGRAPDVTARYMDGELHVIPDTAVPYIAEGRLDPELFNVTKLIAYGYDDAHQDAIPLIATYGKDKRAAAPEGSTKQHTLESINAVALAADKDEAARFWGDATESGGELADSIDKLWLDKPVEASLDTSVPQIGAPEAWAGGKDGKGVAVAVLDTGIDAQHPDVAGKIKEAKNFTTDASVADGHGHGTHVAATVAGNGTKKGVAPGADLYIGKVLDNRGGGSTSAVLAGMEWAAASGAKIISMSLGSTAPSDGTDPMSQAVDRLSASSGALFVIAAGNEGPKDDTVGSPGAAASALTVGAVDKKDGLASFSSRGPLANGGLKPEVTAPGVAIVAARAKGTAMGTPVDANYTSASGTSMATPHVSGAAAIVAQAHPDWTGRQIKAALVGSAKSMAGQTVYQQGSGRIQVPQAVGQQVLASPASLSYDMVSDETTGKIARSLTYRNTTDKALSLSLKAEFNGPVGLFTLADDALTIPAGGTAQTTLNIDPALATAGRYQGAVVATGDGVTVRTPGAIIKDKPYVRMTLPITGRDGSAEHQRTTVYAVNLSTGERFQGYADRQGEASLRVTPGTYAVMASIVGLDPDSGVPRERILAGDPEVAVAGPTTVPLDARVARKVDVTTDRKSETRGMRIGYAFRSQAGGYYTTMHHVNEEWIDDLYITPMKSEASRFEWSARFIRYEEDLGARVEDGPSVDPIYFDNAPRLDGRHSLEVVPVGDASDLTGLDLTGKLALVDDFGGPYSARLAALAEAGAKAVAIAASGPGLFAVDDNSRPTVPTFTVTQAEGAALRKPGTVLNLHGVAVSPFTYDLVTGGKDSGTDKVRYRQGADAIAKIDTRYYAPAGRNQNLNESRGASLGGVWSVFESDRIVAAPLRRDEWVTAGEVSWDHEVALADRTRFYSQDIGYEGGTRRTEDWYRGVLAPTGDPNPVYRSFGSPVSRTSADQMRAVFREFGDSDPTHAGLAGTGDVNVLTLHRDGQLVVKQSAFGGQRLPMVPQEAEYVLTLDTKRDRERFWKRSTRTTTAWTFTSSHVDKDTVLPLLVPRYDLDTDGHGKVRGGGEFAFGLTIGAQSGAELSGPVAGAEVSVSYDGGVTWTKADVERERRGFEVEVDHPATGSVSLKVKAWDTAGNSVEQTVLNAYLLK